MKKLLLTTTCYLSLGILSQPAWAQGQSIGVNAAVKGKVTITAEDAAIRDAILKEEVRLGEEVNSRRESTLQVLLKDQTTFTVGPDCVMVMNEFVYDPNKAGNNLSASVKKGMFRFMSGNISNSTNPNVAIDTPVASMGVRGTIVEGLVGEEAIDIARRIGVLPAGTATDDAGATLFILRGPGLNRTGTVRRGEIDVTSGGKTLRVDQAGYGAFVPASGVEPIGPFPVPDAIFDLFSDQLRTKPRSNTPIGRIEIDHFNIFEDSDWPGEEHMEPTGPGPSPVPGNPCFPNPPNSC